MTSSSSIHGSGFHPHPTNLLGRVERQLGRANDDLLIRKTEFEALQGQIHALPAGCHAYGPAGKRWYDAAVAENLRIDLAVRRAQADRAHAGGLRSPMQSSPALMELSQELSYLQDLLKTPALQYLRGTMEVTSPSVTAVPAGEAPCTAVPTSAAELIAHLPGITDPQRIATVRERANLDLERMNAFNELREELEEKLATHIANHGGEQALDQAAGQALSQRIATAGDALQAAREAVLLARQKVTQANGSHTSLQNLRDALTLYLLRAPTYEQAISEALAIRPSAPAPAPDPAPAPAPAPGPGSPPALAPARAELDRSIAALTRELDALTPKVQLFERLARNGGCATLNAHEAATFNAVLSHRQVLSNGIRVVTDRVNRVNELTNSGSLPESELIIAYKHLQALDGAKDRLLQALNKAGDLPGGGLPPTTRILGSASSPRTAYPDPTLARPATCTNFGGTPYSPLPELPRLTGAPGSASIADLRKEWDKVFNEAIRLTEELRPKLQDLRDRLEDKNALVQEDSGRDYTATLDAQKEDLRIQVQHRNTLAQEARKAPSDLVALNRAVNAGIGVVETLKAQSQLVTMANKAIQTAQYNTANGLNELVSVPERLDWSRGPGTPPLHSISRNLEDRIPAAELEKYPGFAKVPLKDAMRYGLCKEATITTGYRLDSAEVPTEAPFPDNPLNPNTPSLTCPTTYGSKPSQGATPH